MTQDERDAVVELLRCAADSRPEGIGLNGMFDASRDLDISVRLHNDAWDALDAVRDVGLSLVVGTDEFYRARLLEAAQRVEDKEWP